MARLGDICTVSSSNAPISDNRIWLLNLDMVEQQTGNIISYNYVGNDDLNGSIIQFDTDNVLYSKLRPNLNKVVIPDRGGFATSEMLPLKPNASVLCREYLAAYLRSDSFVSWAVSKTAGAKMPRLGTKVLLDKEIPLPPLEEQRRIADLLDKVSDLIAKRRVQLDKLDLLVKARFVEIFENGPKTEKVLLGDISEFVTVGIANSATHAYAKSGVAMLRNQNIKENYLDDSDLIFIKKEFADKYKTKSLKKNDILVIRTGYPGIACLVPAQYEGAQTFTTLIVRLKDCSRINPNFICHYINSSHGKAYVEGTKVGVAQQNFGAKILALMPIMLPESKLQNDFANFCVQIDKLKFSINQGLSKLEILKKALMQQYFE